MIKTTVPAGGLHNEEDLQIEKQGKSACSLSSFREHSMRAGKARVWQVYLAVRLCGFPTALFTEYSQPCHARLAFRGMCQFEKDIKMRVVGGLPASWNSVFYWDIVCYVENRYLFVFVTVIGNETYRTAFFLLLRLA